MTTVLPPLRTGLKPLNVTLLNANQPLVQSWGGHSITEEFYDNDRRVSVEAGCYWPFYDFVVGEPYSKWY